MATIPGSRKHARKVLLTGGLGFIGFHLASKLLECQPDCELTIVDNLSSTQLDYQTLLGRTEIHVCDLRDYMPARHDFDDVFHLASPVGSLGILARHGHIASDILELANCASELAARSGAQLLYLSSSEVYGRDGEHDEQAELRVPDRHGTRMEYALGKLTAEHVLRNLADSGSHELRIVRPFNVVGDQQSEALGFVMPVFFRAALTGVPLPVHGDGRQTRSFCDVDDLVSGLLAVHTKGRSGATYNIGNPYNRVQIEELARLVLKETGSHSTISHIDPTQTYGPHYLEAFNKLPVIKNAFNDCHWQPRVGLDELLRTLHADYRRRLEAEECDQPVSLATADTADQELSGSGSRTEVA